MKTKIILIGVLLLVVVISGCFIQQKPVCGNSICEKGENTANCAQDCKTPTACGNKKCEKGETTNNCCTDCKCPQGKTCTNNTCQPTETCGNGTCETAENSTNCPQDCKITISSEIQRFGVDGTGPKFAAKIADLGDGWSGVNSLSWRNIEPNPPTAGRHSYDWSNFDSTVKTFQAVNRNLQVNIRIFNEWTLEGDEKITVIHPGSLEKIPAIVRVKPENLADWSTFIEEIVERYDADGFNDMPGLKYAITHYQIESEAENVWSNADGYIEALCSASEAAKKANQKTKIMAAGFNIGDFFLLEPETIQKVLDPKTREEFLKDKPTQLRKINFLESFFEKVPTDCFDILSLHLSDDYISIPLTVEYFSQKMQTRNYQKPIWSEDSMSTPNIGRETSSDEEKKIYELLKNNDADAINWLKQEQPKFLVKKAVVAFSSGVEKIFLSSDVDWETYGMLEWRYCGFLNSTGIPKPAFYTYHLMISKLDGFTKLEKLSEEVYKFSFDDKESVIVAWSDNENKTIDISQYVLSQNIKITSIITEQGQTEPKTETKPSNSIPISETPIFIQPFKTSNFFKLEKANGIWWLIDSDGEKFLSKGVNTIWYEKDKETVGWLTSIGLNTMGAWSRISEFATLHQQGMPYTELLSFLKSYARSKNINIDNNFPDIFTEEFAAWVEKRAVEKVKPLANDPLFIGWWTDNELKWQRDTDVHTPILDIYLKLPTGSPGRKTAEDFLMQKFGKPTLPQDANAMQEARDGFIEILLRRYGKIATEAIRKYDKNHLILGDRLFFTPVRPIPERMGGFVSYAKAAKDYWDIISINIYFNEAPLDRIRTLENTFQGPILITEWNVWDAGMLQGLSGEAEWEARAKITAAGYKEQIPLLLAEPYIIGYHYYQYSNKCEPIGPNDLRPALKNCKDEPREIIVNALKKLNQQLEQIHRGT